jgi:hypothetical protein
MAGETSKPEKQHPPRLSQGRNSIVPLQLKWYYDAFRLVFGWAQSIWGDRE